METVLQLLLRVTNTDTDIFTQGSELMQLQQF